MSANDTTDPIAAIVQQFGSTYADGVDETSAIAHARAVAVLAASGREVTEANYLSALQAVSSDEARRNDEDSVSEQCRASQALSELAEENLRTRGVVWASKNYESEYIAEVGLIARSSGLDYRPGFKGA